MGDQEKLFSADVAQDILSAASRKVPGGRISEAQLAQIAEELGISASDLKEEIELVQEQRLREGRTRFERQYRSEFRREQFIKFGVGLLPLVPLVSLAFYWPDWFVLFEMFWVITLPPVVLWFSFMAYWLYTALLLPGWENAYFKVPTEAGPAQQAFRDNRTDVGRTPLLQ